MAEHAPAPAAALVGILVGSQSDLPAAQECARTLEGLGIPYELLVLSAHRTPRRVAHYARTARERGLKVIVAGAGLAAALPGVVAAHTTLPVIGLPLAAGPLNGLDALYAIVQMPPGVPVAAVGIGNARNAAYLAAQVLALLDEGIRERVEAYRRSFGDLAEG